LTVRQVAADAVLYESNQFTSALRQHGHTDCLQGIVN